MGFYSYHKTDKKLLRVYMVWGDALTKLETFVWILNRISRFITWSLFTLKASYLTKWPISTGHFMWWCQFIDWLVKIWNSPQLPAEFRNDQFLLAQQETTEINYAVNFYILNKAFINDNALKVNLWEKNFILFFFVVVFVFVLLNLVHERTVRYSRQIDFENER